MNKDIWNIGITHQTCPTWPCPTCKAGTLSLEKDSLKEAMTEASSKDRDEDWWGPEYVVLSFTARAVCGNPSCLEKFALAGTGGVEVEPDEEGGTAYVEGFTLKYCFPTLHMIAIPKHCPMPIRDALIAAFTVFWVDRPSAAGRIRVAIECLLDHLGISRTSPSGGYLTLDKRIEIFTKTDSIHGSQLMALKWLGNAGAHSATYLEGGALLDAFEILEHVLEELLDKKSAHIAMLASDMLSKYGKPKKPSKA